MRRCLSTALAVAALLNLAAVPAWTQDEQVGPEGGRAVSTTATGDAPQPDAKAAPTPVKAAAAGSVAIKDFSFGPSSVTVNVGDTVTWVNNGRTDHTATASNGSFDTGTLKKGQSGSHTFNSAGSFAYICSLHPFMKGTVVVAGASGGGGGGGGGASSGSGSSGGGAGSAGSTNGTSPAAPAQSAPGIPNTGLDVVWLLFSGVLLLASGLLLRRRLT